jgi:hypothetical protein
VARLIVCNSHRDLAGIAATRLDGFLSAVGSCALTVIETAALLGDGAFGVDEIEGPVNLDDAGCRLLART